MGGDAYTFNLFGLTFNITNMISGLVVCVIVFFLLFGLSRHIQMKPKGGQNVIEWLIDFTNGIVRGQMNREVGARFSYFIFILFVFIFVANQLGLILQVGWNGHELVKSPTADPVITLTFSLMVIVLSHFAGLVNNGIKGYFAEFVSPSALMLPINLIEEVSNFLTLGLRIFGNIYAGELLLGLLGQMAFSHGWPTIIASLPVEMIWQGFSVFIGSIQAYVFVTLTTVYISRKVSGD
ncbi:F0F1 ATP synthase subunit A [Limosilactobacillus coleohominis]|jgi:F-type H+-transporting ATPase subunit a|uniref:ATP synthase subunit a n=3 Tax=Limosilactobacillus coleohominis TaxID=181675 RepID=A0ABS2GYX4_9LACO|nr:F0F1 ATP synthase subunit A [Limosilactobacillus coleohominis]MBM6940475.1 F0F1 ATP synthase subunit A [Limosilactobacillus coleohominis]MCI5813289.1 F0F1 ATP synthase subunit A [Lactobacillus sp.]MDY3703034.1 F0F1 ATP synthase subunit A [Limosilactobacillus coleohominis]MDY5628809.1 F0F1 ATP synthase subunit A [Limosilactobacillus coleohominis]